MGSFHLSDRVMSLAPSATVKMAMRAKEMQDKGISVISLTAGEPDFDPPCVVLDTAKSAIEKKSTNKYTAVRGTPQLISAIRHKVKREQNLDYAAAQTMASVGAKSVLSLAIDALVNPGDEVIIFAPYWVSYPELVRLAGGVPVIVNTSRENGYLPRVSALRDKLTSKTQMLILNSPNNPSGAVWPEALLRDVMKALENTSAWVLSDEIYEHLVFDDHKHVSPATFSADAYGRTLVISGVAKSYAMTGWRVGYATGPQALVDAMVTLQSQRLTCVTAIAQEAAAVALSDDASIQSDIEMMRVAYQARRQKLMELCESLPKVACFKPQGAFYAMLDFSAYMAKTHRGKLIMNDEDLADRLLDEVHVAVVPGTPFGVPGSVRISLAAGMESLVEGMRRISTWLSE